MPLREVDLSFPPYDDRVKMPVARLLGVVSVPTLDVGKSWG